MILAKYLMNFEEIKDFDIEKIKSFLSEQEGVKLKDLKISDLVFFQEEPIYSGNGVYMFKDSTGFVYVGNCRSRNFVERIPAHFDLRIGGWFNSLLKAIIKKKYKKEPTQELLVKAGREVFDNCQLLLINFEKSRYFSEEVSANHCIKKLEDLLRIELKPLNTFKHKRTPKDVKSVKDYILTS